MCVLTSTDYFTTMLHPSLKELTIESDEMIRKGWEPVGGPLVLPSGKFAQCFKRPYSEEVEQIKKKLKSKK